MLLLWPEPLGAQPLLPVLDGGLIQQLLLCNELIVRRLRKPSSSGVQNHTEACSRAGGIVELRHIVTHQGPEIWGQLSAGAKVFVGNGQRGRVWLIRGTILRFWLL